MGLGFPALRLHGRWRQQEYGWLFGQGFCKFEALVHGELPASFQHQRIHCCKHACQSQRLSLAGVQRCRFHCNFEMAPILRELGTAAARVVSKRPAGPPLDFWWCSKWFSIFARNPWSWHLAGLLMCRSSSQSSASIWGQLRSPRCSLHGQKILSFWHGTKDPCLHAFSNRVRRCAGRWQACNVEPCSFRYQHVRRFCGPYQPRNVERSVLGSYQVKARLAIKSFLKQRRRASG